MNPERGISTRVVEVNLSPRILLVDDDSNIRQANTCVLARSGYQVEAAADGEAGWQGISTTQYDLLITDNEMPRLSGLELLERLRSNGVTLPAILASGNVPMEALNAVRSLGIAAILQKPFFSGSLLATVENVLRASVGAETRFVVPIRHVSQGELRPG